MSLCACMSFNKPCEVLLFLFLPYRENSSTAEVARDHTVSCRADCNPGSLTPATLPMLYHPMLPQ